MANLLYLTHRIPFPPDKGDKVRSFHILRHLARRHRVFLGTFIDDPADKVHMGALRQWCAEVQAVEIDPWWSRLRSLSGLMQGRPLSVARYRHPTMDRWVASLLQRQPMDAAVVFSSGVAPLALDTGVPIPVLMDFVDMDSAKWAEYGSRRPGPWGWIFRREARLLGHFERHVAQRAAYSYFVADKERALFLDSAGQDGARIKTMGNGVDAAYFDPAAALHNPYSPDEQAITFTGAMDYWPNVDAVTWFARDVLPALVQRHPRVRLHIVGRSPTQAVCALASRHVSISGTVPDVRPYLRHARVVVAPLRVARGIQNKVLEAMAMAAPVVVAQECHQALALQPVEGVRAATLPAQWVDELDRLLSDPDVAVEAGRRARACVISRFSWEAHLSVLDADLASVIGERAQPGWTRTQPVTPPVTPPVTRLWGQRP